MGDIILFTIRRAMHWLSPISSLLSLACLAHAVVGPGTVTGNTAVADPTICKDNSGTYFVFCMVFSFVRRNISHS